MSFAAVLDWLDDDASVGSAVAHLRHIGVGTIVVLDQCSHGQMVGQPLRSNDGIWVIDVALGLSDEEVDRLRLTLAAGLPAEWVLFADAGECWLPATGRLGGLNDLDDADELVVPRYMVALGPEGPAMPDQPSNEDHAATFLYSQPFASLTTHLDEQPTAPWTEGRLAPRRMVRPTVLARQLEAPESTQTGENAPRRAVPGDLVIAHAPFRTFEQFAQRARRTFTAMAGSGSTPPVEIGTREDWERQVHTATSLERLKRRQAVRSVTALLSQPIPSFQSEEAYLAAIKASEPWLSLAARIGQAEGITSDRPLFHVSTFNRPSVVMPPDRIVKFYGPWRDGQDVLEREIRAHALVAGGDGLNVPRAIAHGVLDDAWRYLFLEWMPGVALSDVRQALGPTDMVGIAVWLGRFVARLHAIPLTAKQRHDGWEAFATELKWRHANARTGRDADLPPHLLAEALEWMPPLEALLPPPDDLVLAHADLKDEHLIGSISAGNFIPAAVIDFGEARLAHPMYELPVTWWSALGGDRNLLAHFLRHAAIPGVASADFPRMALAWAMIHPSWDAVRLGDLEGVANLDDLARRLFGGLESHQP